MNIRNIPTRVLLAESKRRKVRKRIVESSLTKRLENMQQSWKVEEPIDSSDPRSLRWDSPDGSCSLSVLGNRYFTGGIYYIAGISCEDGDFTFDSNDSPTDALVGVCMAANIDPSVYPFAEAIDDMYTIEEELIEIFHEPNQNHRSSPNDWGNDEWAERAMGFGLEPPEEPPY